MNTIKIKMLSLTTATLCAGLLMALPLTCQASEKSAGRITANHNASAADLIAEAEEKMTPQSLPIAYQMILQALEKEPENKKAQFYQAFLKRITLFEGIYARVYPYVEKYGDIQSFTKTIKRMAATNSPTDRFLLSRRQGQTDIRTVAEMQKFLVEYQKASRSFY
ncbi:MAG: hypothetical protein AAGB31_13825, partial [Bdellovibrio sp.]